MASRSRTKAASARYTDELTYPDAVAGVGGGGGGYIVVQKKKGNEKRKFYFRTKASKKDELALPRAFESILGNAELTFESVAEEDLPHVTEVALRCEDEAAGVEQEADAELGGGGGGPVLLYKDMQWHDCKVEALKGAVDPSLASGALFGEDDIRFKLTRPAAAAAAAEQEAAPRRIRGVAQQRAALERELFAPLARQEAPTHMLLVGPDAVGKRSLVEEEALRRGVTVLRMHAPTVLSQSLARGGASPGWSIAGNLRAMFADARRRQARGAVVLIDELHELAPARDTEREPSSEGTLALLAEFEMLRGGPTASFAVVGVAPAANAVDRQLRRYGRFARELLFELPSAAARAEMLRQFSDDGGHAYDGDGDELGEFARVDLQGFVASDIKALVRHAELECAARGGGTTQSSGMAVDRPWVECLRAALLVVKPESVRSGGLGDVEVPSVRWQDVGGMRAARARLREAVDLPLRYEALYAKLQVRPSRNVLLFGPPGTGKTMVAKAIATETRANFLAVQGPELLSMWSGQSESNVREVFARARAAAPCVLFFDEIDSLAGRRDVGDGGGGGGSGSGGGGDRVVNQILTEMDGVTSSDKVIVLGATNRIQSLDAALLRPGRFENIVFVAIPDADERRDIVEKVLRDVAVSEGARARLLLEAGYDGKFNYASPADIAGVVRRAAALAVSRIVPKDDGGGEKLSAKDIAAAEITEADVRQALASMRVSTDQKTYLTQYKEVAEKLGIVESSGAEGAARTSAENEF